MPSAAQTQLLEQKLAKIRVPTSDISIIVKNFDKLAGGIIGGILAPEKMKKIAEEIVTNPTFRKEFIKDFKGAVEKFGGDWE